MIIGFVGTPGSGKSYEAVKKLLDNLRLGRVIYTNIDGLDDDFHREHIKVYCGLDDYQLSRQLRFLTNTEMQYFWKVAEPGSLIMVDEVHKLFSNRDWASDSNKEFTEWASTHRHHGFDVVLITQDIEKVDKHARSLLEWSYFFRKVNFFGGAVTKKYICYAYSGDDHHGKPISTQTRHYNQKIFKCYKSYVAKDVKELGFMTHVNVLKHPVFFFIPLLFIATIVMGSRSSLATGDIFGTKKIVAKKTSPFTDPATVKKPSFIQNQRVAANASSSVSAPAASSPPVSQKIYKWQAPDGSIKFSNVPPSGGVVLASWDVP
ncbi:MAG: Zonular occludens toxin [uncultured bacterium]|nr:MAG: Zonular occludens toxin [uncultured bacterium]